MIESIYRKFINEKASSPIALHRHNTQAWIEEILSVTGCIFQFEGKLVCSLEIETFYLRNLSAQYVTLQFFRMIAEIYTVPLERHNIKEDFEEGSSVIGYYK